MVYPESRGTYSYTGPMDKILDRSYVPMKILEGLKPNGEPWETLVMAVVHLTGILHTGYVFQSVESGKKANKG
jgi:hypothetical protein